MDVQTQAYNLYLKHEQEYTILVKQHTRYYESECMSEVLEWLPRIINGYDPIHGLTLYQWSVVILRCKLPNYLANICSHDASLIDDHIADALPYKECIRLSANKQCTFLVSRPKQSVETRIIVAELLSILRSSITRQEFDLLWCRHVEEYKLVQLAYKMGLSTAQAAVKLDRLENYVQQVLQHVI